MSFGEISMSDKLILLHDGKEKVINVFIHGYSAIHNDEELNSLSEQILNAKPVGKVFLLVWSSGKLKTIGIAARGLYYAFKIGRNAFRAAPTLNVVSSLSEPFYQIAKFKYFEHKSELLGKKLNKYLKRLNGKFPNTPINLIGHSLGSRAIHYAMHHSELSNYNVKDVVFIGGAADANDGDWVECADSIRGKIFNIYSSNDSTLKYLTPDLRPRIGRDGIPYSYHKIKHKHLGSFGHKEYWANLEYVLQVGWKTFKQSKSIPRYYSAYEVDCPYCSTDLIIEDAEIESDEWIECPECKLDFDFDGIDTFCVDQDIYCHCGRTYYRMKETNPAKVGEYFICKHCGDNYIVDSD